MFGNKLKKEITKLLLNQELMMQSLEDLEKDAEKRGIMISKINDHVQNMLLSQNAKSESKGIFSLKMRK